MKQNVNILNDLNELASKFDLIPQVVVSDVLKRIYDWTSSGGNIYDDYVRKQIKYALSFTKGDNYELKKRN